jgi:hypothetical protein
VHGIFAKFLAVPAADRDRLVFQLGVKPPAGVSQPEDIRLMIGAGAAARRIAIDAGWHLRLPLEPELLRDNPTITTNLAAGSPLVLRPQLGIAPLPGRTWAAVDLAAALRQANVAVRAQAGMFALFAPRAKSVRFRFGDPAATIRIEEGQASRLLSANGEGDVLVPLDSRMLKNKAWLHLSAEPKAVLPHFPMSMTLTVDGDSK